MRRWLALLGVGVLVAASAASNARAGEQFSATVSAGADQSLSCSALNVGRSDVRMRIELFQTGEYEGTPNPPTSSYPPGATVGASAVGPVSGFCRLSYAGSKKKVRAVLRVTDGDGVVALYPLD